MNAYYSAKDRITSFFKKNVEEQRDELVRLTKECLVFGQYLLIDTGSVVFLFDTNVAFKFNTDFLDHLDNTEIFMWSFIEYSKTTDLDEWVNNEMTAESLAEWYYYQNEIRAINGIYINCFAVKDRKQGIDELLKELNLTYDFSGHSYLVTFVDVTRYEFFGHL
jgi:hypothetical protein